MAVECYIQINSKEWELIRFYYTRSNKGHRMRRESLQWLGLSCSNSLDAGSSPHALQAIQAASIVAGLPFAFLLLFLVPSIWNFCDQAVKDPKKEDYVLSWHPSSAFLCTEESGMSSSGPPVSAESTINALNVAWICL